MSEVPFAPLAAATRPGYLVVDEFLRGFVEARVLKTAFEIGLIDRLLEHGAGAAAALAPVVGLDQAGLRFLLDLLAAAGVVQEARGDVRLTRRFQEALRFRDLLEVKLDYAGFTITDFADLFTPLVQTPSAFASKARLFALFDYRRALDPTFDNYARTRVWVRLTSKLTRYEAAPCLDVYDMGGHRRMLDVGGNSGEFAVQACRRHGSLRATVFDLPLICELGLGHVLAQAESSRISFIQGDLRSQDLPGGYDLITFKSMLHDWPPQDALGFIDKAARALAPGGTLLIYERGALEFGGQVPPMSMVPNLLFFRSYRSPQAYIEQLRRLGFQDIRKRDVALDSDFFVITARSPGG
jgi:SAM-dependent methyltransferase